MKATTMILRTFVIASVGMLLPLGCRKAPESPERASSSEAGPAEGAAIESGYTQAQLAQRAAAADRLYTFMPRRRPVAIEQPITMLSIRGPTMTEADLKFILAPFLDELERLIITNVPLTPDILPFLATMLNLKVLELEWSGLAASDSRHFPGSLDIAVTVKPVCEPASPWIVADDDLAFGEWTTSADGSLSMRMMVEVGARQVAEPLRLFAEFRNNTDNPICIARRFTIGASRWPAIEGPNGEIRLLDPRPGIRMKVHRYSILRPGGIYRDMESMVPEFWPGSDAPGQYSLSYKYAVSRDCRVLEKVLKRYGMTGEPVATWLGEIQSPPITIEKR